MFKTQKNQNLKKSCNLSKIVSVTLPASVKRLSVSHMWDFLKLVWPFTLPYRFILIVWTSDKGIYIGIYIYKQPNNSDKGR